MNHLKGLLLSTLLLITGIIYSMEKNSNIILPKSNNLRMGNFDKLPKDMQKEIFNYIFNQQYIDSLSLEQLRKVFNLKSLNKKFKDFITKEYEEEIKTKKNKLSLELIECVKNYQPINSIKKILFKDQTLKKIKQLIELGANPNKYDDKGFTALMYAFLNQHQDLIEFLLNSGSDINIKNTFGKTFFMSICHVYNCFNSRNSNNYDILNHQNIAKSLISKKANINLQDNDGDTALMFACYQGGISILQSLRIEIIKLLISARADINKQNKIGQTALMIASSEDKLKIADLLINAKANLNLQNDAGKTALIKACENGSLELTKLLINSGADIDILDHKRKTTLMAAVYYGSKPEIIKILIDTKIKKSGQEALKIYINLKNKKNDTALHKACLDCNTKIIKYLLDYGADPNLQDKDDNTPLIRASKRKILPSNECSEIETMKILIKHKANIDLQNNEGYSSLMMASVPSGIKETKLLIDSKANLYLKNKDGETALDIAESWEAPDIAKLLEDAMKKESQESKEEEENN